MEIERDALAYAGQYLAAHDASTNPDQPFRTRLAHMERVCVWVERLLEPGGVSDARALRLAAAMHDAGYADAADGHGRHSAWLILSYAQEKGIDMQVAERAAWLAGEHSNKAKWMTNADAPRDLIVLMEADLLDEEGAMGLALDCITAGSLGLGYEGAYDRMMRFEPPRLARNPMVTPLGRQFWEWKQRIIRDFMAAYAFDLGIDDGDEIG